MLNKQKPLIIGIAGASGTGKTTLAKRLKRDSREWQTVSLDNYFKHPRTFPTKGTFLNWEHPLNLDFELLYQHLRALKLGKTVHTRTFPKRPGGRRYPLVLYPRKYVIVEGFILFKNRKIRRVLNIKIYLDLPSHLLLQWRARRFKREINEYDRRVAIPEFLKDGAVQKRYADFVIDARKSLAEKELLLRKVIWSDKHS